MSKIIASVLLLIAASLSMPSFAANECPGKKFRKTGQSCASIGLNSNTAICRSGDRYAMLCDDKKGGYIRTCSSGIRCGGKKPSSRGPRKGTWDGDYVYFEGDWHHCSSLYFNKKKVPLKFCPRGTVNEDCRRKCEREEDGYGGGYNERYDDPREGEWDGDFVYYRGEWQKCESLRFERGRPVGFCKKNRYNSNCKGTCEGRRWSLF